MHPETDADPVWVADLSGRPSADVKAALGEAAGERRLFDHLAREHRAEGRASYVEIDAPLELHALVRLLRPRHVVEVGVASGVSSAYLLHALAKNQRGTLHSVDLPSRPRPRAPGAKPPRWSWSLPPGRTSGWAVPLRLRDRWDLRIGDKAKVLPLLADELPSVEMFVYDVPHEDRSAAAEFRSLDPLLSTGGVAIVDHGPGGDVCPALAAWARSRGTNSVRRSGLGLAGMRAGRRRVSARRPRC